MCTFTSYVIVIVIGLHQTGKSLLSSPTALHAASGGEGWGGRPRGSSPRPQGTIVARISAHNQPARLCPEMFQVCDAMWRGVGVLLVLMTDALLEVTMFPVALLLALLHIPCVPWVMRTFYWSLPFMVPVMKGRFWIKYVSCG